MPDPRGRSRVRFPPEYPICLSVEGLGRLVGSASSGADQAGRNRRNPHQALGLAASPTGFTPPVPKPAPTHAHLERRPIATRDTHQVERCVERPLSLPPLPPSGSRRAGAVPHGTRGAHAGWDPFSTRQASLRRCNVLGRSRVAFPRRLCRVRMRNRIPPGEEVIHRPRPARPRTTCLRDRHRSRHRHPEVTVHMTCPVETLTVGPLTAQIEPDPEPSHPTGRRPPRAHDLPPQPLLSR